MLRIQAKQQMHATDRGGMSTSRSLAVRIWPTPPVAPATSIRSPGTWTHKTWDSHALNF